MGPGIAVSRLYLWPSLSAGVEGAAGSPERNRAYTYVCARDRIVCAGLCGGLSLCCPVWFPFFGTEPFQFFVCKGPQKLLHMDFPLSFWHEDEGAQTWNIPSPGGGSRKEASKGKTLVLGAG